MNWKDYFMGLAWYIGKKSKDTTKVGAVAIGQANQILETGYNGLPRKVKDLPERMERPEKYLWTAHAEENLVTTAARTRLEGSTVYVTHLCCNSCVRMLINSGVKKLVIGNGQTSMPKELFEVAMKMINEAEIELEYHTDE
jgi:dCMP deaminase